MRILRLDLRDGRGTVDLHPFVSIVRGLDPMQVDDLVGAVRGLVRGAGAGLGGLVESNGELVELRGDGAENIGPLTTEDIFVRMERLDTEKVDETAVRAELDQLRHRATIEAVLVEETRADLDTRAPARVQRIRQALLRDAGDEDHDRRIAAVLAAVEVARVVPPVLHETPAEVLELIASWERYDAVRREAQPEIDKLAQRVESLIRQRQAAIDAVAAAKEAAQPVMLSVEDDRRVEELAHRQATTKKKLTSQEDAELDALLAKVGQPTYVGYAMYRLSPKAAPETLAVVDSAMGALERLDADLEEARADLESGEVTTALNAELDMVKAEARQHLGPMLPSDLGTALRSMVVEVENPDFLPAMRSLFDVLVDEHIVVPQTMEPEDLVAWVDDWIVAEQAPAGHEGPTRGELQAGLSVAMAELDRHTRAMARIDRLEATASESHQRVLELERQLERVGEPQGNSADVAVARLRPLADSIRSEAGGSVPLVLQGEFDDLGDDEVRVLLDELEVLAQDLQLVILTNRESAVEWAGDVGLRRALGSTLC